MSDLLAYEVGMDGLGSEGHTNRVVMSYVSGNNFALLGLEPALGRLIVGSEGQHPDDDPVIVLGYSYWKRHFGGSTGIWAGGCL